MRRAVGFTFIGEGKSHGNKITAPFRVSEVSEGTEAAKKLLVGDEIVQVDGLRVDGSVDMSALRKVIIANASPSVTVEVRRGEESHKVSINKRASSNRISSRSSTYADNKLQSSDRRRESINVDETEVPISPSHHTTSRETVKSMVKLRQSPSQPVSERSCRPAISPPPIPPKSEEMSQNGGGLHMQTHEQLAGGLQKGLTRHSGAWEGGAAGAPFTPPHSGSSRGSKWGMSQPGGWATDAPSIGTNGTSPTLSSSSTRCAPAGGEGEGAWESLLGTPAGKRESSGGSGSIEELERGLIASVNELAAQRETANALLLELLALKKKISATARSISVRNGSVMEEWDNNMRIMRNELFSMCGLLAEAEGELKVAMERADERVSNVTTAIFNTMGEDGDDGASSGRIMEKGALKLGREDYVDFRLELGVVRQRLRSAVNTCQNCILALEDDLDSISEQARLSDLHCESLHREHKLEKQLNLNAAKQRSSCDNPFLCGGSRISSCQSR